MQRTHYRHDGTKEKTEKKNTKPRKRDNEKRTKKRHPEYGHIFLNIQLKVWVSDFTSTLRTALFVLNCLIYLCDNFWVAQSAFTLKSVQKCCKNAGTIGASRTQQIDDVVEVSLLANVGSSAFQPGLRTATCFIYGKSCVCRLQLVAKKK